MPDQSATIKLPIKVAIDTSGIGGPSAGLAFTLEVMQKLGRNVLHGHKVAATGEMELNGQVGPIGGIKQKTYGVRQAGADVFLVPAGPEREGRAPLRRAGSHHPGPQHRPGVARSGNAAARRRRNRRFPAARNCRKFVSFRLRQRLLLRDLPLSSHLESGPQFLEQRPR